MYRAILSVLLVFPWLSWADDSAELKKMLDRVEVLEGRFEQVLKSPQGEVLQESKGAFTLKRPGYFHWQSDAPYEQVVVGTPEKVWIYDPDLEQVTVRNQNAHNSPASIISGDLATLQEFYSVTKSQNAKLQIYKLKPLAAEEHYKSIELTFKKNKMVTLTFQDKLDQITTIGFSKTKENRKVAKNLFEFAVPEGVDVIVDE